MKRWLKYSISTSQKPVKNREFIKIFNVIKTTRTKLLFYLHDTVFDGSTVCPVYGIIAWIDHTVESYIMRCDGYYR
jgi:hypothetical protein